MVDVLCPSMTTSIIKHACRILFNSTGPVNEFTAASIPVYMYVLINLLSSTIRARDGLDGSRRCIFEM